MLQNDLPDKDTNFQFITVVTTPCILADKYRRFVGTYCLHLQGARFSFSLKLNIAVADRDIDPSPRAKQHVTDTILPGVYTSPLPLHAQ
jgi:hypothetical protein